VLEHTLQERPVEDDLDRRLQAELLANSARLPGHYEDAWRLADSITVKPEEGPGARLLLCHQAYGEGARGRDRARAIERASQGLSAISEEERAWNLTDLGASLRRGNRRAEARDCLRAGLELAQRLGAIVLADRAHEELVATGARPRRIVLSGVDSLTPSERRIAAMAAEGLSNREIAQALFVTLRTVEMHLSNAFRKLDVSSRTQLPAALASSAAEAFAASTI
jgi:DNA-binding CsgD family transcriptional regulator